MTDKNLWLSVSNTMTFNRIIYQAPQIAVNNEEHHHIHLRKICFNSLYK